MAKKVTKKIKLQLPAGKATAPLVGTVLGPAGVNLQEFCTKFNDASKEKVGDILPVEISVYEDRSFDFEIKTPPAAFLIKKYAKLQSGSAKGANHIVATLTEKDIKEIAEIKMQDLNAYDLESAMRIIEGTARNLGVAVKGVNDQELQEQGKEALEAEKELARREAELTKLEEAANEAATHVHEEPEEAEETEETEETKEAEENK